MELDIQVKTLKQLVKALGDKKAVLGSCAWRYADRADGDMIHIELGNLDIPSLEVLRDVLKDREEGGVRRVTQLLNVLKDPENKKVANLNDFPEALRQYMKQQNAQWLYSLHASQKGVCYAVSDCSYSLGHRHDMPVVQIGLVFNNQMTFKRWTVCLDAKDMRDTVPNILRRHNLLVPDEDMLAEYEAHNAKYQKFGGMVGEQFLVRKEATEVSRDFWWSSNTVNLTTKGKPSKAVMDTDMTEGDRSRSSFYSELLAKQVPVPTHPVLNLFSLAHHVNVWVNVANIKEYKYETDLRERLVLPPTHSRLIGALVANLEVLQMESEGTDRSKLFRAKASSSIILAKGPAGTGKTLTAEVYAEEIKRPLYEVSSGQIGVEPEEIEKNLNEILERSTRLKMPLLINEADVFIQRRDRNLHQNAVVSVFLRLFEYHTGLIFLTTNRAEDIDEAILSRCLAEVAYGVPETDERRRIWKVLLKEFNVELSKADLEGAVHAFPTAVGRDIQNLIRLTSRVCTALNEPFDLQALKNNAAFRGIAVAKGKTNAG